MVIDDNIITLDRKEAKELVDNECRDKFGISVADYMWKYRRGELTAGEEASIHKIKMLLRLVYK